MDSGADSDLIDSITADVMTCLHRSFFFERLDDLLSPQEDSHQREVCVGNYTLSKRVLEASGFDPDDLQDIFNVLRAQGGHCDCEILYNVAESSRLKSEYWKERASERLALRPKQSTLSRLNERNRDFSPIGFPSVIG